MFSRSKRNLFNFRGDIFNLPLVRTRASAAAKPKKKDWQSVVGLEVHAQINTNSKLFSGASTCFGSPVNANVALLDAAIPGALPVLNKKCVELGVLTALALSCEVNEISMFDRKHYFYADLPAGYQITQQRKALANNGLLCFPVFNPAKHKTPSVSSSKILQLQLEQDSGKSLHDEQLQRSLIDLNRAGIPLMEIVFAPDLTDGEEAAALIKELVLILTRIGTCSCKMEEGALRVDANISVHKPGEELGVRTEVKNIGSIRGVANAVDFEIERQIDLLSCGEKIVNETRSWDAVSCKTVPMRDKEVKQDYRFMPETNLPPLRLNMCREPHDELVNVELLRENIPELPSATRDMLKSKYCLNDDLILHLVGNDRLLNLFKRVMLAGCRDPKIVACLLTIELMTLVNSNMTTLDNKKFNETTIGSITDLLQTEEINLATAKKIMEEIACGNPCTPEEIVDQLGLRQITDINELTEICKKIVEANPKLVCKYQSGKTKVFSAFLGMVAAETQNKAKMDIVVKLLKEMLDKKC